MKETDENIENQFGDLKKDQPFQVPGGYFESFADRLMVRIKEEEHLNKKRSLFIYLKPILMMAASILLVMLLVSVPIKKFFPSDKGSIALQQLNTYSVAADSMVPVTLISYFSDTQFLSAVTDMDELESDTISNADLGDYIAANYSDYDVIANN
jgi:hypothetical protein